jgi:hypothetical protein
MYAAETSNAEGGRGEKRLEIRLGRQIQTKHQGVSTIVLY